MAISEEVLSRFTLCRVFLTVVCLLHKTFKVKTSFIVVLLRDRVGSLNALLNNSWLLFNMQMFNGLHHFRPVDCPKSFKTYGQNGLLFEGVYSYWESLFVDCFLNTRSWILFARNPKRNRVFCRYIGNTNLLLRSARSLNKITGSKE